MHMIISYAPSKHAHPLHTIVLFGKTKLEAYDGNPNVMTIVENDSVGTRLLMCIFRSNTTHT